MKNQFRKHFKPSLLDRLNTFYYRLIGVKIGDSSYIQYGAKLERYYKNISIGKRTIIKPFSRICSCNEKSLIKIGDDVSIGHYSFIYSSEKIVIGNRCMIAPFNYFVDSNHGIQKAEIPFQSGNKCEPIIINNDCWIGQNSTILAGSTMQEGSVLGSKSLLNDEIKAYQIFGGVPAKLISTRK